MLLIFLLDVRSYPYLIINFNVENKNSTSPKPKEETLFTSLLGACLAVTHFPYFGPGGAAELDDVPHNTRGIRAVATARRRLAAAVRCPSGDLLVGTALQRNAQAPVPPDW